MEPFEPHVEKLVRFIEDQFGILTDDQAERLLQLIDSIVNTEWNKGWDTLEEYLRGIIG